MGFITYRFFLLLLLTAFFFKGNCTAQVIRYVSIAGSNNNPDIAYSWSSGTADLQGAINASAPGDQVWVAQGVYKPTSLTGPTSRTVSFSMKDQVGIYGGFIGNEITLDQRPVIDPTLSQYSSSTLSGDIGASNTTTDNSYHVLANPPILSSTAILDGFVITGGNANRNPSGSSPDNYGGGMYNNGINPGVCSPTLKNCLFIDNQAQYAGGIYNYGGPATLNGNGGTSNPTILNCSFIRNVAISRGGALYNLGENRGGTSSPQLTRCSFSLNSAPEGGAIYNQGDFYGVANPTLLACNFTYNSGSSGGAIANNGSTPLLTNCAFFANTASSGGAVYNVAFRGTSSPQFTNCSFMSNQSVLYNDGYYGTVAPVLTNCALFNNGASKTFYNQEGASTRLEHSLVDSNASGYTGVNSFTTVSSPFLSNSSLLLSPCSPAINTGLNAATGLVGVTTDLVGNPRIIEQQVDIGAYEFNGLPLGRSRRLYVNTLATGTKSGLDWANAFTDLQAALFYPCVADTLEIWVASGVYKPTTTASRDISFALRNNLTLYGGFLGTETTLTDRPSINLAKPLSTTLSGDIGLPNNAADNSYHVISNRAGLNQTAVLDGFVIANGNANDNTLNDTRRLGGGIYNDGRGSFCSPVIRNCLFINNSASLGGAILNDGTEQGNSSPTILNCFFRNNSASSGGGAIYNGGSQGESSPLIINCAFTNNLAIGSAPGGAIYNFVSGGVSSPVLSNCSFYKNIALGNGGAVYSNSYQGVSTTTINNCIAYKSPASPTLDFQGVFGASIQVQYSLISSGTEGYANGPGNLTISEMPFADTTSLQLSATAQAVNAGNPASQIISTGPYSVTGLPATDLANQLRVVGSRIDIGAYEYQTIVDISIRSVRDGLWNDTATWSCGCTPAREQLIQIYHNVTIPAGYQAFGAKLDYSAQGRLTINSTGRLKLGF